jgi:hypothetical protein
LSEVARDALLSKSFYSLEVYYWEEYCERLCSVMARNISSSQLDRYAKLLSILS